MQYNQNKLKRSNILCVAARLKHVSLFPLMGDDAAKGDLFDDLAFGVLWTIDSDVLPNVFEYFFRDKFGLLI